MDATLRTHSIASRYMMSALVRILSTRGYIEAVPRCPNLVWTSAEAITFSGLTTAIVNLVLTGVRQAC